MDGWESRRHCATHDWVIIKLGATGSVVGMDIDTSHFNGNEGPAASVYGASFGSNDSITHDSSVVSKLCPHNLLLLTISLLSGQKSYR